ERRAGGEAFLVEGARALEIALVLGLQRPRVEVLRGPEARLDLLQALGDVLVLGLRALARREQLEGPLEVPRGLRRDGLLVALLDTRALDELVLDPGQALPGIAEGSGD